MSNIAPHAGQEWNLVLIGEKPFAVIELEKDVDQYNYVTKHPELYEFVLAKGEDGEEVRFWKKGCVQGSLNYVKYLSLLRNAIEFIDKYGKDWYTREMGQIFGYTEEQIKAFIDGDLKCTCTKCQGMSRE